MCARERKRKGRKKNKKSCLLSAVEDRFQPHWALAHLHSPECPSRRQANTSEGLIPTPHQHHPTPPSTTTTTTSLFAPCINIGGCLRSCVYLGQRVCGTSQEALSCLPNTAACQACHANNSASFTSLSLSLSVSLSPATLSADDATRRRRNVFVFFYPSVSFFFLFFNTPFWLKY